MAILLGLVSLSRFLYIHCRSGVLLSVGRFKVVCDISLSKTLVISRVIFVYSSMWDSVFLLN